MSVKVKSLNCRVCGKRVRTRFGSSFSNRMRQYPADHKDQDGKLCDGWSAGIEWHLSTQTQETQLP
jgi:hypothetical protein